MKENVFELFSGDGTRIVVGLDNRPDLRKAPRTDLHPLAEPRDIPPDPFRRSPHASVVRHRREDINDGPERIVVNAERPTPGAAIFLIGPGTVEHPQQTSRTLLYENLLHLPRPPGEHRAAPAPPFSVVVLEDPVGLFDSCPFRDHEAAFTLSPSALIAQASGCDST